MSDYPTPIRVMIVDDHPAVRRGMAFLVQHCDDLALVGQASNGLEALSMCNEVQPQVVLMDLDMPIMDGLAAATAIRAAHSEVQIILLSNLGDIGASDLSRAAVRAGAASSLIKNMLSIDQLAEAIRRAAIAIPAQMA